jgi:hypothetical protein
MNLCQFIAILRLLRLSWTMFRMFDGSLDGMV